MALAPERRAAQVVALCLTRLSDLKTQSLSLTRQVLDERERVEVTLECLHPIINHTADWPKWINCAIKTQQFVTNNEAHIDDNVNVSFEAEIIYVAISKTAESIWPTGRWQVRHTTCSTPCGIVWDEDKRSCWAIDKLIGKLCRIFCYMCVWNVYENQTLRWEYVLEKQTIGLFRSIASERQAYKQKIRKFRPCRRGPGGRVETKMGTTMTIRRIFYNWWTKRRLRGLSAAASELSKHHWT